jgi:hypothetical protein
MCTRRNDLEVDQLLIRDDLQVDAEAAAPAAADVFEVLVERTHRSPDDLRHLTNAAFSVLLLDQHAIRDMSAAVLDRTTSELGLRMLFQPVGDESRYCW